MTVANPFLPFHSAAPFQGTPSFTPAHVINLTPTQFNPCSYKAWRALRPARCRTDMATSSSLAAATGTSSAKTSPYIIGGAIAGAILLALLAGALVYLLCRRRKAHIGRRMTFHRTRMVKSLPPPTFAVPHDAQIDSPIHDQDGMGARYPQYMQQVLPAASAPYPFARTA